MKLDVLLWEHVEASRNTENLPGDWPAFVVEVADTAPANPPYLRMTTTDYNNYIADSDRRARHAAAASASAQPESIRKALLRAQDFGRSMVVEFGVWVTQQNYQYSEANQVANKLVEVQQLLAAGALYTAHYALTIMTPEGRVTQQVIDDQKAKIAAYLGI